MAAMWGGFLSFEGERGVGGNSVVVEKSRIR